MAEAGDVFAAARPLEATGFVPGTDASRAVIVWEQSGLSRRRSLIIRGG